MILPPTTQIWISTRPADFRLSFDRLAELVWERFRLRPHSGHLFLFHNQTKDRVKLLYHDGTGFNILYKRLDQGTFKLPVNKNQRVQIKASDLQALLHGLSSLKAA